MDKLENLREQRREIDRKIKELLERDTVYEDAKYFVQRYAVRPERATGKWIDADLDKDFWTCSECKKSGCRDRTAWRPDYVKTHFRFCPNCGAQMERRDG